jgi:hypothetical protein
MSRLNSKRIALVAVCLVGCAGLNGCIPHSENDFTVGNQMATDTWTTGVNTDPGAAREPNVTTGAGTYRAIDEKNGVKYP